MVEDIKMYIKEILATIIAVTFLIVMGFVMIEHMRLESQGGCQCEKEADAYINPSNCYINDNDDREIINKQ